MRDRLEGEITHSRTRIITLERTNSTLEANISRNDATIARKEVELEASVEALEEKDSIISGMREQLTKTREFLSAKQQVSIMQFYLHADCHKSGDRL